MAMCTVQYRVDSYGVVGDRVSQSVYRIDGNYVNVNQGEDLRRNTAENMPSCLHVSVETDPLKSNRVACSP